MPVKPPLRITRTAGSDAGTTRLTLEGEVDLATSPFLAMSLGEISGHVELNLDKVDFMDSSGLKVLLDHRNRLDADGGSLSVVKTSPQVQRLFELSSLTGVFASDSFRDRPQIEGLHP